MRLRGVSSEEEKNKNNLEESELILTSGVGGLGDFKPETKLGLERDPAMVGDPQTAQLDQPMNITKVLTGNRLNAYLHFAFYHFLISDV